MCVCVETVLGLRQPLSHPHVPGGMKYTPNEHKHVLLLAAGSGVTPFVQLLTNSLAYGKPDSASAGWVGWLGWLVGLVGWLFGFA